MADNIAGWIEDLQSPDESARSDAARELCCAGEESRSAAVELAIAACDVEEEVREWANAALEELGPPNAEDAGRLAELLKQPELDVAYWAATLLGRLDDRAAVAVSVLIDALTGHPQDAVKQRAAWALGKIGAKAIDALPALESIAAASGDLRLARLARQAIDAIRA